jgi:D-sedoheptulose 7-phosphate isomerase
MKENIKSEIKESIKVKEKFMSDNKLLQKLNDLTILCYDVVSRNNKIIFCGNGGSFADAQHLTAEFVSKLRIDRNPLPALTLGTNSSNLSAIANDYGYSNIFSREIISLGKEGDLLIPISTSGNSENIISAIKQAKKLKINVVGLTGKIGGKMSKICNTINVPSNTTEKIQECHIMIGHIMCALVEKKIFK